MITVIALVPADLVTLAMKEADSSLPGVILTDLVEGVVPALAENLEQHPHNTIHVRFGDGSGEFTEAFSFPKDKVTLILRTF